MEGRHERSGFIAISRHERCPPGRSHARLHVRIRQLVRDRGACRRAAGRAKFASKGQFWPLCRAVVGLPVHGTAGQQPALVALPHPPHRQALRPLQEDRSGTHSYRPLGAGGKRPPDRSAALGADPDAGRDTDFRERPAHHDHGRRRRDTNRHGGTCAARHRLHAERVLLQCGWRAADCCAGAQPSFPHRVRRHRDRAWRDLRDPARHDLQGRTHRWTCARVCV